MTIAVETLKKAKIAIFANPSYVDADPAPEGGYAALAAALKSDGNKVRAFTDASAEGFAAALKGRDVLVIPELQNLGLGLTPELVRVIRDFVGNGGTLVMGGDSNDNDVALLNAVFGFSVSKGFSLDQGESIAKVAPPEEASGNTFADGPASVLANVSTELLFDLSLPANALDLYAYGYGVAAAAVGFGAGQIVYLGWDWSSGAPNGAQDGGWLSVLDAAISRSDGRIVGTAGPDTLAGFQTRPGEALSSEYADVILGKGGDDYLDGGGGNDRIKGGSGEDTLFGAEGKDKLYGGGDDDYLADFGGGARMWGNGGSDTFAFSLPGIAKASTIMDFKHGVDSLLLDLNEFEELVDGVLPASSFHKGSKATTADHRIIYDKNGKLYYDPDGDGTVQKVLFAKLDGHPRLSHDDIMVHVFG